MDVTGKVVIVTGASRGIGEATVRLLTQKGAKVALVARDQARLEELAKELPGSEAFVCDMTKFDKVRKTIQKIAEKFGTIDILINNAGRGYDAAIENITIERFHEIFDLDVVGPVVAMQTVIPIMKEKKGGSIVNISSGTALMSLPNMPAYSSLKRAIAGISLTARQELQKFHINVSVVYPFITETDFEKNTLRDGEMSWEENGDREIPDADSPNFVAEKILYAIEKEEAEVFAHDWMKPH